MKWRFIFSRILEFAYAAVRYLFGAWCFLWGVLAIVAIIDMIRNAPRFISQ